MLIERPTPADLLLVDGKNALWRAADAHPELCTEVAGEGIVQTGAIYGFLMIVCRAYRELGGMVVVCWDDWEHGPAERKKMFPDYKLRKPEKDPVKAAEKRERLESMAVQQTRLMEILQLAGVTQAYSPRWEADDVMATLARRLGDDKTTAILTADRDLLQCVREDKHGCVVVARPQKDGTFAVEGPDSVSEEWGVSAGQWVDFKALAGDTGDNIPGCKGIGPKFAADILAAYGAAEVAIEAADGSVPWKLSDGLRNKVAAGASSIRLSYRLAQINHQVPIRFLPRTPDKKRLLDAFVRLKFKSMLTSNRYLELMEMSGA
jgi:DNA polymerase-1